MVETKNVTDSAVSGEYPETAAGKTHTFSLCNVRYVRDWVNGSTSNVGNHWVEIQVWGQRSVTYIGNYLEWTGATDTMKTYYYAGATRAAMREGSSLYYLLGDHLGSTSLVTDPGGVILSATRYDPWGELRAVSGPSQTRYGYTGQRAEKGLGLYFYGARWYDPQLGRFLSADSIIPQQQGVQAWDRYAYVNNNALKYTDPTGHWRDCPGDVNCDGTPRQTPIPSQTATSTPTPTATATVNPTYVAAQRTITASWGYPYTPLSTEQSESRWVTTPSPLSRHNSAPDAFAMDRLSDATSIGPVLRSGVNGAAPSPALMLAGGYLAGAAQWERDSELYLTTPQRLGRAAIVGVEATGVATISTFAALIPAVAMGANFGPVGFGVGFFTGYVSVGTVLADQVYDEWNDNIFTRFGLDAGTCTSP